jgi:amino acid permease
MLSSVMGVEGLGFFFFFNSVLWASGLRVLGLMSWVSCPFWSLLCILLVYLGAPYAF